MPLKCGFLSACELDLTNYLPHQADSENRLFQEQAVLS